MFSDRQRKDSKNVQKVLSVVKIPQKGEKALHL